MKLKEIYDIFIKEGIKADARSGQQIQRYVQEKRAQFNKLSASEKKLFDKECFKNPYADTRILYGNLNTEIRRILVGIDMEVSEVLMASHLNQQDGGIDLILAHHPEGVALAGLHDVMSMQIDFLRNLGLSEKPAQKLMEKRISEVARRLHSANHTRSVDAARVLNMPMMCCHTPADNHVDQYLQKLFNKMKPKNLKQIIDLLMKEPEYQIATRYKAGPEILIGSRKDKVGKIYVDMTGGTEGSNAIYGRMHELGIDTVVGMHFSEQHYKNMKNEYINVVNAGHIASDNLGMNLLLDKVEKKHKLEIIPCSGFKRIKR